MATYSLEEGFQAGEKQPSPAGTAQGGDVELSKGGDAHPRTFASLLCRETGDPAPTPSHMLGSIGVGETLPFPTEAKAWVWGSWQRKASSVELQRTKCLDITAMFLPGPPLLLAHFQASSLCAEWKSWVSLRARRRGECFFWLFPHTQVCLAVSAHLGEPEPNVNHCRLNPTVWDVCPEPAPTV